MLSNLVMSTFIKETMYIEFYSHKTLSHLFLLICMSYHPIYLYGTSFNENETPMKPSMRMT